MGTYRLAISTYLLGIHTFRLAISTYLLGIHTYCLAIGTFCFAIGTYRLAIGTDRLAIGTRPPPPPGDRHFHVFLVNIYCAGLCCPSALYMALQCFPVTSNQSHVCILWCSLSKGVVRVPFANHTFE